MSTAVSTQPKGLDRCADQIRTAQHKAQRSFAEYIETVGGELEKAQRLLADHHAGFGQWVRDEFGWNTSQADRLIKAAATMRILSPIGETKNLPLPATESQCRPLASLPAEDVPVVWEQICAASEQTGKPITAAVVKAVVDELSPEEKPSAKPRKPAANNAAARQADEEIEPDRMLDEISYYALAFLDACPERADELEGLLLTWVSRCKQR
jgi:hypothetical protein